jgi:hypothetical protein
MVSCAHGNIHITCGLRRSVVYYANTNASEAHTASIFVAVEHNAKVPQRAVDPLIDRATIGAALERPGGGGSTGKPLQLDGAALRPSTALVPSDCQTVVTRNEVR